MREMVNDPEGTDLTATSASFTVEPIQQWCSTLDAQRKRPAPGCVDLRMPR